MSKTILILVSLMILISKKMQQAKQISKQIMPTKISFLILIKINKKKQRIRKQTI